MIHADNNIDWYKWHAVVNIHFEFRLTLFL